MHDVALAFFWHQHQPYYPDDLGGENPMPWVRLHGAKDYWGMAMLVRELPELRLTINLVPSLIAQIEAYTGRGHVDTHLRVSRLAPDDLSADDAAYLLDNFFMVHPDHNIRPFRRYQELYQKRGIGVDTAERARKRFSKRDLVDLVCWSNLVWFHPLAFELDKDLAAFREKGRGWSEKDKQWLLDKQLELLRQVVPLHRELQERGQVELTTSPFYHPILPLLWDKRQARRAMPDVQLPHFLEGYAADAGEQIRRAVAFHRKTFGQAPRGMWPSEGSVCQGIVPLIAEAGLQWIATDEEILACSTDGWVSRDHNGYLRNPEMLYRPWRLEEASRSLQIVFRDHAMSDLIGFHYQRYQPEHAVADFVSRIEAIAGATQANAAHRPSLVNVILDGENCWEYYPNAGLEFLRGLYRRVVQHPRIKPVRLSDYLEKYPATDRIGNLFPGSWIQHDFAIWIGHPECNRAWDLLHQTRQYLVARGADKSPSAEFDRAWEELYVAEGSDWFWWFGDSHSCAQKNLFDRLFRKHLQNVYTLLGDSPPAELLRAISQGFRQRLHSEPTGLLKVKVDGRQTYFEWINAGHYVCGGARGTMTMVREGLLAGLYFGFDTERLYLRLDARGGPCRERLADADSLRVVFLEPEMLELRVFHPGQKQPAVELRQGPGALPAPGVEAAADTILEIAVPFRVLSVAVDDPIHFYVELLHEGQAIERVPHEGAIETTVPSPDFERMMWQA